MSDEPKKPTIKNAFNDEVFERTVAEKDNVSPALKPREYLITFSPETAPPGAIGVQRHLPSQNAISTQNAQTIDLSGNDIDFEDLKHDYTVQTKIEDKPNKMGLDGGLISRMTIFKGERIEENICAHFQNGEWEISAGTFLEKQLVMEAKNEYNGIERNDIEPSFGHDPDDDIDL